MAEPGISVAVPVYNVAAYLDHCVESALAQAYPKLEVLLVDDGSTDGSGALCDAWAARDARVRVVHQANRGLSEARNTLIERAAGELLMFLDGDDYLAPGIVERMYRAKAEHGAQLACCLIRRVRDGEGDAPLPGEPRAERLSREQALERMLRQSGITNSACAKLYDRALFSGVRYPAGELFEDLATTYRVMSRIERAALVRIEGYCYRARGGSIQRSPFSAAKRAELRFAREQKAYLDARFPQLEAATSDRLVSCCFHELFSMGEDEDFPGERAELIREIRARRLRMILGRGTSPKTRLGCLASYLGMNRARRIYERLGMRGRLLG